MPRGRRLFLVPRSGAPVHASGPPARYLRWLHLSGVPADLATRLWSALFTVPHDDGHRLIWFFETLERRGPSGLRPAMHRHLAAFPIFRWQALLEVMVAKGTLTRQDANALLEGLLAFVGRSGEWRG